MASAIDKIYSLSNSVTDQLSQSGAIDKLKSMTEGIPSIGMNMPKAVTDQISNLKGASAMTGEAYFLEASFMIFFACLLAQVTLVKMRVLNRKR